MFVKNAALLQDTVPRGWEFNARHHRDKTLEPRSPAHDGLFGKPRFLTHDSDPPEEAEDHRNDPATSSPPAAPPRSSSPPEAELPLFEPTPPVPAPLVPVRLPPEPQAHAPTPTRTQARIPSSTSPSPMKLLPSSSLPDAFVASSPARLPDTDAITKALHESLTSLLGKRPIAEEDETMRDASGGGPNGAKKGKRVRPGGPSNVRVHRSFAFGVSWGSRCACPVIRHM